MIRKIVSDGRIVIPRAIRDKLDIYPGQEMDIILTEDKKSILIRPIEQLKVCVNCGNIMMKGVCEQCEKRNKKKKKKQN